MPSSPKFPAAKWVLIIILGIAIIWAVSRRERKETPVPGAGTRQTTSPAPAGPVASGTAAATPGSAVAAATPVPNYPDFQIRPLPVARETGSHQWTSGDGKSPDVQMSH